MATKKLLTYEGLEEYNIKWHERLQSLVIDADDVEEIFVDAIMQNYTWSYEFDTTFGFEQISTAYGIAIRHPWYYTTLDYPYVLGAVPFSLFGTENASMTIDWGDGTVETLTSADYQSRIICPHSIHEYANPGTYTISVTSSNWNQIYISGGCVSIGYYGAGSMPYRAVYDDRVTQEKHHEPDYFVHPDLGGGYEDTIQNMMSLMRLGLKKILNPLPKLAGTLVSENYNNLSDFSDVDYGVDEGTYTGIPEFVGIPIYGTKLQNQLYFVFDDSHILGNNYPSDIFTYNKSLQILGAFGELDEVNGVKTPHVYVDNDAVQSLDSFTFGILSGKADIKATTNDSWSGYGMGENPLDGEYTSETGFYHNKEAVIAETDYLWLTDLFAIENITLIDTNNNQHILQFKDEITIIDSNDNIITGSALSNYDLNVDGGYCVGDIDPEILVDGYSVLAEAEESTDGYVNGYGKWVIKISRVGDIKTYSGGDKSAKVEVSLKWMHPDSY